MGQTIIMDSITTFLTHPAITAIMGVVIGIVGQFFLRNQISKHEIRKMKIEAKKAQLEQLKQCAEQLMIQTMAYDDLANHVIVTIAHGLHDKERLDDLQKKIKKIKDEISPKLQIHFSDLASHQNNYSEAIKAFNNSFFRGLEYVDAINQRGWTSEDKKRMNNELREVFTQKGTLIQETLKYLEKKEKLVYKD